MSESRERTARGRVSSLVFISHDTRDALLAAHFSALLQNVSAGLIKSFRSTDKKGRQGIEYGLEWYQELMDKLRTASDTVCLLTPRSVDRPWILYEAGVAKGMHDTPVLGIALDIPLKRANTGPFAQFQNCDADPESLTFLMHQLLLRLPGADPNREAIKSHVEHFLREIGGVLENLREQDGSGEVNGQDLLGERLFEEVKVMFNDLPRRIGQEFTKGYVAPSGGSYKHRPFSMENIESFIHQVSPDTEEPIGILIIASLLREDTPWLYELGMEVFRTVVSRKPRGIARSLKTFKIAMESTAKSTINDSRGWLPHHYDSLLRMYEIVEDLARSR